MDTSNASELPPGDELGRKCIVVLKAGMPGNMEENVSTSIVGNSGGENRKVRGVRKYTMRWKVVHYEMGYKK